jgi:hypothetical protein
VAVNKQTLFRRKRLFLPKFTMALVTTIKGFVISVSINSKMLKQIKVNKNEMKESNQMFSKFGK